MVLRDRTSTALRQADAKLFVVEDGDRVIMPSDD
jgi:hypothetical protein